MNKQKKHKIKPEETTNLIIQIIIGIAILVLLCLIGIYVFNQSEIVFQDNCRYLGGEIFYTQNVTCKTYFESCRLNCKFSNGDIVNFYDDFNGKNLCIKSCEIYNKKTKGINCVC